jgi:hypothetical protein
LTEPEAATTTSDKPKIVQIATTTEDISTSSPSVIETPKATTTEAAKPSEASDFDRDGLSDTEEILLGTNFESIDSDSDTFDDYSELLNLYNPAGEGTLIVNANISKYSNGSYQYSLYHPAAWKLETIGGEESILFRASNNQFIQIIVAVNSEGESIENWYKEKISDSPVKPEQKYYKKGWTGVRSNDGLNIYLMNPTQSHVFTVTYNTGITNTTDFKAIFEMMVKSLQAVN